MILDALGIVLLASLALALRSDWNYRTAFVDEANSLYSGWQLLHGQDIYTMAYYTTWPYLGMLPLSLADAAGGLAAARALNALWGVLTVLVVMLTARRLYDRIAGYIAGGIFAVFGPAIYLSTFASSDALAVFLVSFAIYLWVLALVDDLRILYVLGSLVMIGGVLTNYSAIVLALMSLVCVTASAVFAATTKSSDGGKGAAAPPFERALRRLPFMWLPFALLPVYVLVYKSDLLLMWQSRVLANSMAAPGSAWEFFTQLRNYLWLPFLVGLTAFDWRGRRLFSGWLLLLSLAMMAYQWWSKDATRLVVHTCYMLVGLAPLVGGGVVTWTHGWDKTLVVRVTRLVVAVAGVAVAGYIGWAGQQALPGLRDYWPDVSQLTENLRANVKDGEVILMEQGAIGRYYLITYGTPGHIPSQVWDTWWYQDEEGQGADFALYERAILQKRFDYVVFDYSVTGDLDRALLGALESGYGLHATFGALAGRDGRIDVLKKITSE